MRYALIFLLFLQGCALMRVASPSEHNYNVANRYYNRQNYTRAAAYYEKYLKSNPRGSLAIPAKLNLGMSYFYMEKHQEAYDILKAVSVKDPQLEAYLNTIRKKCEECIKVQLPRPKRKGVITITVTDAYIDDANNTVVEGTISHKGKVFVNTTEATVSEKRQFYASINWRKGEPITLVAQDMQGGESEIEYFPDSEPPQEPEGLAAINTTDNSVELEWDQNPEADIKGYQLFYRLQNGPQQETPDLITDITYEVFGLKTLTDGANKTFEFFLRAVDKMDNYSDPSDTLAVTIP